MNAHDKQGLEGLHPALWRASQLGRAITRCIDTGHPVLSKELAGNGWPTGALIELMVQQAGIGEMRLLAPALAKVADRQVMMIEPPHPPHIAALAGMGLAPADVIWVKSKVSANALWTAEQVLRSGSFGAVLFWATHIRPESLRRLNLAAQAGETLFYVFRPLATVQDPSPSPLRLSLRPAEGGIEIGLVKHRGPQRDESLFVPLDGPVHRIHRPIVEVDPLPSAPVSQPSKAPAPVELFI